MCVYVYVCHVYLHLFCKDSLVFTVYDEDTGKSDDFLGMVTLRFEASSGWELLVCLLTQLLVGGLWV